MSAKRLADNDVRNWWGEQVNDRPVWLVRDLPDPSYAGVLTALQLGYRLRNNLVVLGRPNTGQTTLESAYFFEILSKTLETNKAYALGGLPAIRHYLGDDSIPQEVHAWSPVSNTRIAFDSFALVVVRKSGMFAGESAALRSQTEITARGYRLVWETPESLLLSLRPQWLTEQAGTVATFLKTYAFDLDRLWKLVSGEKRPLAARRLADAFAVVGKGNEAKLMAAAAGLAKYKLPGREKKGLLPARLEKPVHLSDPPYVTRFRDELRLFAGVLGAEAWGGSLERTPWSAAQITAYAESAKKYDTYHSSTIEGYRVSPEEVQLLIEGRATPDASLASGSEIENRMALRGYLDAFRFTLDAIANDLGKRKPLTETLMQDIFANLFSPSVKAGLNTAEELIRYRNHPVYLNGSRYVPPQNAKVPELMTALVEEINEIERAPVRAILAHYGFVTIHPYKDGNGRTARLLMNYALGAAGIPWLTIRVEDRTAYFKALETAQCEQDVGPFAQFMKRYFDALPVEPGLHAGGER